MAFATLDQALSVLRNIQKRVQQRPRHSESIKLRIALSIEAIQPSLSGIGRYTWELAQGLREDRRITDLRYYRNGRWIADPALYLRDPEGNTNRRSFVRRWLDKQLNSRNMNDRLFHGPNYFLPSGTEGGVITVHDLSVLRYPETHPLERVRHFEREFASSIARASYILTDSESVRREVLALTNFSTDKVVAVGLGVSDQFHPMPMQEIQPVLDGFGLIAGQYALCVSTLDPRKRIAELVEAWMTLPDRLGQRWPLVVAGGTGWFSEDLKLLMARAEIQRCVKYIGFVAESTLPTLYAGAHLFCYPSIYEGFGLPPIEAMASGVPVVISDAECLVEVTRGGALQCNPDDQNSLKSAVERGLTDDEWRIKASLQGAETASRYRWDRCVRETADVYSKAIASQ